MYQLERIRAPILFQIPEREYRMTLDYALPLMRRHQADIYVFPGETHVKYQPRHMLAVYKRNVRLAPLLAARLCRFEGVEIPAIPHLA